jgi:ribosomal-protein-alanine N-acetyltransferase
MTFHLRPINEYDLQQIKHINDLVQRVPWQLNDIISEFMQNNPQSIVASADDGQVLGYLFTRNAGDSFEVMTLGVSPDAQRHGVARALMNHLVDSAPNQAEVFLEVSDLNAPALALYTCLGFEKQSIREHYYKDGSNAICMKLILAKT